MRNVGMNLVEPDAVSAAWRGEAGIGLPFLPFSSFRAPQLHANAPNRSAKATSCSLTACRTGGGMHRPLRHPALLLSAVFPRCFGDGQRTDRFPAFGLHHPQDHDCMIAVGIYDLFHLAFD